MDDANDLDHKMALFSDVEDDDQVLQKLFDSIDRNKDGILSYDEIHEAFSILKPTASRTSKNLALLEKFEAELQIFCQGQASGTLSPTQFKEIAMKVPRIHGQRILWAHSLNLSNLLASRLQVGDFLDELSGIRSMTEAELDAAIRVFCSDAASIIKQEWQSLKDTDSSPTDATSAAEAALGKFAGPIGKFGDNLMFQEGLENQIGAPDPFVLKGIFRDCVSAEGSTNVSRTSNYWIVYCDKQEYARLFGNPSEYVRDENTKLKEKDMIENIPTFLIEVAKGLHPGIHGPSEAELKALEDDFKMLRECYNEVCEANTKNTFPGDLGNVQQSMDIEFEACNVEEAIRLHNAIASKAKDGSMVPFVDVGVLPVNNSFSISAVAPLSFFAARKDEQFLQSIQDGTTSTAKVTRKGPNSTYIYCNVGKDGKPANLQELLQDLDLPELSYLSALSPATSSKADHIQFITDTVSQTEPTGSAPKKFIFIQGRRSLTLRELMALEDVKRAGLRVEEAIQAHQYTGPIFQVSRVFVMGCWRSPASRVTCVVCRLNCVLQKLPPPSPC